MTDAPNPPRSAPPISTGVVYLLAVLLVSTLWGAWLGMGTALLSAAAFNFFHIPPTGRFTIAEGENWVALAVFLIAAGAASWLAQLARARAEEAEQRSLEADLAAEMARLLLSGSLALAAAGQRLAIAFELPSAEIRLVEPPEGSVDPARRLALPVDAGAGRTATLVVPASASERVRERLERAVVPSLGTLVAAALDREELQAEVVETQALRRSDVVKTALLRAVSHDLRSPLTAISAAADAVGSTTLTDADRAELSALITSESSRLADLVEKLLDLSKLEGGAAEPRSARSRRSWSPRWTACRRAARRCDSSSTRVSRSSAPTPPSSGVRSRTCWRTLAATRTSRSRSGRASWANG